MFAVRLRSPLVVALTGAALTVLAAGPTVAAATPRALSTDSTTAGIVQPGERYGGKTYGEWSAVWWKWAMGIAEPNSPVTDDTGADCAVRQDQRAWLLAGNRGGSSSRACTIPANKGVLFPIINASCWSPDDGTTEAELRACAASFIGQVTEATASLDGTPLDLGSASGGQFRFTSPVFTLKIVDGNGFGAAPGKKRAVSDGFWVLLKPLTVGQHTLDFHGNAPGLGFEVNVHYDLTVVRS